MYSIKLWHILKKNCGKVPINIGSLNIDLYYGNHFLIDNATANV